MRNHNDLKPGSCFHKYPCICRAKRLCTWLRAGGINYLPFIHVNATPFMYVTPQPFMYVNTSPSKQIYAPDCPYVYMLCHEPIRTMLPEFMFLSSHERRVMLPEQADSEHPPVG